MRRILTAATLGLALVSASACSQTPATAPSNPAAAPATTAAATPTAPVIDKATACAALSKAAEQFEADAVAAMKAIVESSADKTKAGTAATQLLAAFKDFQKAYVDNAAVSDAELKAAIEADLKVLDPAIAAVTAAGADLGKIEAAFNAPGIDEAGTTVDKLCKA